MAFKIVFDAYHLYHLPQFEPVIDLITEDDRFEVYLSTSSKNHPDEITLILKILKSRKVNIIYRDNEEERAVAVRSIEPDVFICGWSRYPIPKFVNSNTIVAMIYHGIGVKPSYWRDNHSRLDVRFVEGPLRETQLKNVDAKAELVMTGFTKLDPLFHRTSYNRKEILEELSLDPDQKTILYAPTFYPSSLKKLVKPFLNEMDGYNVIIKPHSWVFFPDAFTGVNLRPQLKWLHKLDEKPNISLITPENYNIVPYLFCSDLLITEASSSIYEMMALDKPVVMCTFYSLKWSHWLSRKRLFQRRLDKEMSEGMTDFCIPLNKPSHLKKTVELGLSEYDPNPDKRDIYKKEMLYTLDGKAANRIQEYLLEKLHANKRKI